jgi:putative ABC transport system permease protein
MLKNFITVAVRNLGRQKGFAFITVLGLTIGLTASALIILYIIHELGYDRFHENSKRLYRVAIEGTISGQPLDVAVSSPPFGPALRSNYPEVIDYTRLDLVRSSSLMAAGNHKYYEEDILFADSSFFNMFTVPLLYGDPQTALDVPRSIVLSESIAKKYFRDEVPVGRILRFNDQLDLTITGVCKDYPDNSHFTFNSVISFSTLMELRGEQWFESWGSLSMYTYILLDEYALEDSLIAKMPGFLRNHFGEEVQESSVNLNPYLQPITSIHLHSNLMAEMGDNSDINYIRLLVAITLFILILASINFMNLSTAKSANRAREVGIRKVVGSSRRKLIIQFIGESVIFSLLALMVTFILIELILPAFNSITGKNLDMQYILDWQVTCGFLLLALLVGISAGSYPALYLSSFNPIRVLQGRLKAGSSNSLLRNILVFVQFAVSITLIIGTVVIYRQLKFIQNKDLGFDKENIVIFTFRNPETMENGHLLKTGFTGIPGVTGASLSNGYPGGMLSGTGYFPEGYGDTDPWLIYGFAADPDFAENTMHMSVLRGRNFSKELASDSTSVLINETLLKDLAWDDPVDRVITSGGPDSTQFRIIGIVRDFHNQSLHQQINPIMIRYLREPPRFMLVKIRTGDMQSILAELRSVWQNINPEIPFDYEFLDERVAQFYEYEEKIGKILVYFTLFALFIASLGLYGLASFVSEQRTKEIGIRKAMGSTAGKISLILSRNFTRPVLLANLIAWPVAWYAMNRWLQEFQYQTDIPYWAFAAAGIFALAIALVTVNIHTFRAASANPVDALRYE